MYTCVSIYNLTMECMDRLVPGLLFPCTNNLNNHVSHDASVALVRSRCDTLRKRKRLRDGGVRSQLSERRRHG